MSDDAGQIPADIASEGAKVSKGVAQGIAETLGTVAGQVTGKKAKKQQDPVEELKRRDQEFKELAQREILAKLRRIAAEERRLTQERAQKEQDWAVAQREKLVPPPQIERQTHKGGQLRELPQVAKQRAETKVGWGAG